MPKNRKIPGSALRKRVRGGGFFGDAAVVTGSSKPVFAAHVNEVVRCVGGVKRIRPTVRGVDAGQVVRWCGSPLGEVGMGCQRLRRSPACAVVARGVPVGMLRQPLTQHAQRLLF